jgi:glutamine amidotransferase PdxT
MNIAIYWGQHIEKLSYDKNMEFFKDKYDIIANKITIKDILLNKLQNYNLFVIPGGQLFHLQNEIGVNGKTKILNYLKNGGKYIGICAGCFLATKELYFMGEKICSKNFLQLFDSSKASHINLKKNIVTDSGKTLLYWNGPLEIKCNDEWQILDTINGSPCTIKKDNVLLFTCHPELGNFDYYYNFLEKS